jgi:hypothetical protein
MVASLCNDAGIEHVPGDLFEKIIKNLTVSPGLKLVMEHGCPMALYQVTLRVRQRTPLLIRELLQPTYCILFGRPAIGDFFSPFVRVVTYGFIGGPAMGDRPDNKHTSIRFRIILACYPEH